MLGFLKSSILKQCVMLVTFLIDRQKLHLTGKAPKKPGQGKKLLFFLTPWWGYLDTPLMSIFSFEKISKLYPKSKKCIYSIIYAYFLFSAIPRLGNGFSWADLEFRWNLNKNLGMTILVNLSPTIALFLKSEPSFNHIKTSNS